MNHKKKSILAETTNRKKILHWKIIAAYLVVYDILAVNVAYFSALFLRFDLHFDKIPKEYLFSFLKFAPFYTIAVLVVFRFFGLYNSVWRFASISELNRITGASIVTSAFHIIGITVCVYRMPISYYVFGAILQYCLTIVVRFGYRFILLERARRTKVLTAKHNVMVIGAGAAGLSIIRELKSSDKIEGNPCCVIDDNQNKWKRNMAGVPIVGGRDSIMENVEKYHIDLIMLAIPSASRNERRDILNICKETNCELRSLPGMYQLAKGEVTLEKMKPVNVLDLLGRDPVCVNLNDIHEHVRGKVILVTGGGGSIGSELCRQIAVHQPKQLIIFDVYENGAYEIEQELKRKYKDSLDLVTLIGSVRDSRRINMVFEKYRPQLVYHAAAHKHVPLMEMSPNESIKNNAIGTFKTAKAALKYGTERFVLISTDKAVNPTNIMGASKRLCEMIIQSMDAVSKSGRTDLIPTLYAHESHEMEGQMLFDLQNRGGTQFMAVRFGNVLGSNGSVVPLFKKQIEEGGPVTVTHPDIVRYFMTIPEAVSLVLQAGVYGRGGEIFVLDMGDQVKIDTLARNLIKLSGLTPDVDIPIEYTGLRPGEKLYEERLMEEEGMNHTENEMIHVGRPIPFDIKLFFEQLEELAKASYDNSDHIVELVEKMVPTFHPAGDNPSEEIAKVNTSGTMAEPVS